MNNIRKKFQLDQLHTAHITGSKITVAVLDSGIYPHRDFAGRIIHFKDFINNRSLENPRDRGACWAAVYGVAQSRTQLL